MNFKSILEKIFEKISSTENKDAKDKAYKFLEEAISKNKIYKHQFEVLGLLESKKGKISNSLELDNLIKQVNKKNYTFIKENKNVNSLSIWQENKKLLENYNINPSSISTSVLDKAIDIDNNNKMNEHAIKTYIGKVKKVDELYEKYKLLSKTKSIKELNKALKEVRIIADNIDDDNKVYIYESISKLRENKELEYNQTIKKLYSLHKVIKSLNKK